ncbi:MAG: pilus assembly protein PilM, partial [Candidatus Saccharimonadales bacterium]|nr:pilus assembly protein PilM [Candidatus Saccharimonadales bacterium]
MGASDFFGLDIGTTAVRAVQLRGGASKSLVRYGSIPVDAKVSQSDSAQDRKVLSSAVASLVKQAGLSVNNVVVGVPSNKMFATVVDFPKMSKADLEKTILYQAEAHIPMSLAEAKLDWAVLGDSPVDPKKNEVLLASVPNTYAESRLDMLESIGLNVVALEPDAIALSRSLLPRGSQGAHMVLDIGNTATDLVVTLNDSPRLIRSIPTGGSTFIKAAIQNLSVDEKQAQQFVFKFGLNQDKLEGQVYKALESTVDTLVAEIQKSVKFFTTRYKGVGFEKIVMSGGA